MKPLPESLIQVVCIKCSAGASCRVGLDGSKRDARAHPEQGLNDWSYALALNAAAAVANCHHVRPPL
jgi:hypothetical protein